MDLGRVLGNVFKVVTFVFIVSCCLAVISAFFLGGLAR